MSFESFGGFYDITNAELDKTVMLMKKNRTLSTEIEYKQEIWNI